MVSRREAAHLGRDRAGELIAVEGQRGEQREAAHLGRDSCRKLIAAEVSCVYWKSSVGIVPVRPWL